MYAVIESGGKQYQAVPGEYVDVEKLPVDVGAELTLERVLMVVDGDEVQVGQPLVKGAQVTVTVIGQRRSRKVLHFQYLAKKRERKKQGHRQHYTRLRIDKIQV
jgi:large subunit ribosomal protein L21